jgi:hypothetical protein
MSGAFNVEAGTSTARDLAGQLSPPQTDEFEALYATGPDTAGELEGTLRLALARTEG